MILKHLANGKFILQLKLISCHQRITKTNNRKIMIGVDTREIIRELFKMLLRKMNCFCGIVDRRKTFTPYFQPGSLSEILTIANLRQPASKI